jgi:hypothetical protein
VVGHIQLNGAGLGADDRVQVDLLRAREACTRSQLPSSPPVTRTSARSLVKPWALCPVVA